jgi:hypothetical protein
MLQPNAPSATVAAPQALQPAREVAADPEKELWELIEKTAQGFLEFAEIARAKIQEYIDDEQLRELLDVPFRLLERNMQSGEKSMLTFLRIHQPLPQLGENPAFNVYQLENCNTFLFNIITPGVAAAASYTTHDIDIECYNCYTVPERAIYLNRDMNPSNVLDMLSLYHELVHVGQDNAARSHIQCKEAFANYLLFHVVTKNRPSNTYIDTEWVAYAMGLELLNVIVDNQLRHLSSSTPLTHECILDNIKLIREALPQGYDPSRPFVRTPLMLRYASAYFPSGQANKILPSRFCEQVNHDFQNHHLYARVPEESILARPILASPNAAAAKYVCCIRRGARAWIDPSTFSAFSS